MNAADLSKKNLSLPFFSILIPTRDRPDLLGDLINSVLIQSFEDFELVIADNSTNELTQNLINKKNDPRIVNFKTGQLNMADNWDKGIEKCCGKYLLLFSDKMLLKRGSLEFLHKFIEAYQPDCVNWDIDSFFDFENCFSESRKTEISSQIDSKDLLKAMFSSEFDSVRLPCHCNSVISMDLIKKIKEKTGRVSFQLNPDYTLSYQVCLNTKKIFNLNKALSILRYPNLKGGYGNGTSFMVKTEQAASFMQDNSDWISRTDKYTDVRIPSNLFGLDLILKDLYFILEKYKVDADSLLSQEERHINYYYYTFREILFRTNMNADMRREISVWKEFLDAESEVIKLKVYKMTKKSFLELKFIRLKRFLTKYGSFALLFHSIGNLIYRRNITKFSSLEECLEQTSIIEP